MKIKETKEKILDELEGLKEFELIWSEEITYSVVVKAKNEDEAKDMLLNGDIETTENDITDCDIIENSLEVYEI